MMRPEHTLVIEDEVQIVNGTLSAAVIHNDDCRIVVWGGLDEWRRRWVYARALKCLRWQMRSGRRTIPCVYNLPMHRVPLFDPRSESIQ